jgi:hypothetical protein
MQGHHISELIRDYGRSLLYGRHTAQIATRPALTPFEKGVMAARLGMERDDNPYLPETHARSDWQAGYESSVDVAEAMDLD